MDVQKLPVGFMDSGLGGLSVLKAAAKLLPHEDFIYYGDSANAPYGTKTADEVRALTLRVVDILAAKGIKGMVVACNTATSAAIRTLRDKYPDMPVLGIEPAIKPAVESGRGGEILVMATPMTIREKKFRDLLDRYKDKADIIAVSCGGLMEFVESGRTDGAELDAYLDEHLKPYLSDRTESIVLGCTHYPFLKPHLREYVGGGVRMIDGSDGTARELRRQLEERGLLRESGHTGRIDIYNSIDDTKMTELSHRLFNMDI